MKKTIFFVALSGILAFSFRPVSNPCTDCELFKQGVHYTTTSFDADGKATSTNASTVDKVSSSGDVTSADLTTISKKIDGKGGDTVHFQITCGNDKMTFDMKSFMMNSSTSQTAKNITMKTEGSAMEYPNVLSVGAGLPDGAVKMDMFKDGKPMMTTDMKFHDRKVVAQESKTTKAGTFDCYKITETIDATTSMGTTKFPTTQILRIEWFSHKDGMIRTEAYIKDKLNSSTELTEIKMP